MFVSCSDNSINPQVEIKDGPWEFSSADSLESLMAALWLSSELEAPESLAECILHDLAQIRDQYGSEIPIVVPQTDKLRFTIPWRPSEIKLLINSEASELFDSGDWRVFETLNATFEVNDIDRFDWFDSELLALRFDGTKNSVLIAEAYAELDGVLEVGIEYSGSDIGGVGVRRQPTYLWPYLDENYISYLFIVPHEKPSLVISGYEYWYFRSSGDVCELVGYWDRRTGGIWPEWWEEATRVLDEFDEFLEQWGSFGSTRYR
jgi:hypothetical protein